MRWLSVEQIPPKHDKIGKGIVVNARPFAHSALRRARRSLWIVLQTTCFPNVTRADTGYTTGNLIAL
jgi:hypothetical protein